MLVYRSRQVTNRSVQSPFERTVIMGTDRRRQANQLFTNLLEVIDYFERLGTRLRNIQGNASGHNGSRNGEYLISRFRYA